MAKSQTAISVFTTFELNIPESLFRAKKMNIVFETSRDHLLV